MRFGIRTYERPPAAHYWTGEGKVRAPTLVQQYARNSGEHHVRRPAMRDRSPPPTRDRNVKRRPS
jgi:hypothetical protein